MIISIAIIALFCEYIDATIGMGYGTIMTPLLLFFGFTPLQVVPAVLLSELITGVLAGFFHHRERNINLKPHTTNTSLIIKKIKLLGFIESYKRGVPLHLKVVLLLVACSFFGAVIAVLTSQIISQLLLKLYIGSLAVTMGIIILICLNKEFSFSWIKIGSLGLIASFNKGLTGGGYGPLITSGQILSGVEGKSAVGITSLAEGLTCLIGVATYYIVMSKNHIDLNLASIITAGAVFSLPLSTKSVKKINTRRLKLLIGILTLILGTITIINTLLKI